MRCPPDKAGAYTAVVIVCAIVAMIVISACVVAGDTGPRADGLAGIATGMATGTAGGPPRQRARSRRPTAPA